MHDWMRAVRKPTSYRVGNTRFNLKPQFQLVIMAFCTLFIIIYIMLVFSDTPTKPSTSKEVSVVSNIRFGK